MPNEEGMHIRLATALSKIVFQYEEVSVTFIKSHQRADAKSPLALLTLGVGLDDEVVLEVEGPNATTLLAELEACFLKGFSSEE